MTTLKFVIGDTETAGLGKEKRIVEIGLMEIDPDTFEVIDSINSLIDPEIPINPSATAIHGISDEMVATAPTMAEFIKHSLEGGVPGDIVLICHNIGFDRPLLEPIGNIVAGICSLFESRQAQSLMPGLVDCKLQTLREYFGIEANAAHRALDDCEITRLVLQKIVGLTGRSLRDLAALKERTVHIMPFGKHQGTPIMLLPRNYLTWSLDNMDLEPNLKASMQKALALK